MCVLLHQSHNLCFSIDIIFVLDVYRTWRIHDTPTEISLDQLNRIKHILLTNVDENGMCTSVAQQYTNENGSLDWSVARDIQPSEGSQIYKCMREHYDED